MSVMKMSCPRYSGRLLLALCGLFLLAACAGGSPTQQPTPKGPAQQLPQATPTAPPATATSLAPSSGATLNACSLLTKQEVEAAIAKPVLDPQPDKVSVPQAAGCTFGDPEAPLFGLVGISVISGPDVSAAKFSYELGKGNAGSAQTVTGLGDDAYWAEALNDLGVLKGKYDITIGVTAGAKQDRQSIAKGLASKAISRLP